MIGLCLSLLGIDKNLLGWLTAGAKSLFAVWYRLAIAALLAACIWLYVGKSSALASAAKWKRTAEVEMALRISNEVAYRDAQKVAAEMNRRKVAEYEERERNHAITTDKTIRNNVNLALAGLRARQAAQSSASRAGNAETPATSSDTSGTSGLPVMDAGNTGNEDDVRICTENTILAKGWQDFYAGLMDIEQ